MNLLIFGGLLAFGLLALLGSVFLARGERQDGQAAAKAATVPSPSATAKTTQPLKPLSDTPETPDTPAAKMPQTEETLPAVREETPLMLNGQFHELANELRTLHEYAIELEHRLSVLTGIVDHIEHTQANHINIEEEAETPALG
ncbi:MAG TPA: hypothetical protein VIY29_12120 [Ktedonobacteraceae bacterium]